MLYLIQIHLILQRAWIDAFNFTTEKDYGDLISMQRKKELGWYNQYFKYLQ